MQVASWCVWFQATLPTSHLLPSTIFFKTYKEFMIQNGQLMCWVPGYTLSTAHLLPSTIFFTTYKEFMIQWPAYVLCSRLRSQQPTCYPAQFSSQPTKNSWYNGQLMFWVPGYAPNSPPVTQHNFLHNLQIIHDTMASLRCIGFQATLPTSHLLPSTIFFTTYKEFMIQWPAYVLGSRLRSTHPACYPGTILFTTYKEFMIQWPAYVLGSRLCLPHPTCYPAQFSSQPTKNSWYNGQLMCWVPGYASHIPPVTQHNFLHNLQRIHDTMASLRCIGFQATLPTSHLLPSTIFFTTYKEFMIQWPAYVLGSRLRSTHPTCYPAPFYSQPANILIKLYLSWAKKTVFFQCKITVFFVCKSVILKNMNYLYLKGSVTAPDPQQHCLKDFSLVKSHSSGTIRFLWAIPVTDRISWWAPGSAYQPTPPHPHHVTRPGSCIVNPYTMHILYSRNFYHNKHDDMALLQCNSVVYPADTLCDIMLQWKQNFLKWCLRQYLPYCTENHLQIS
jgi:hypothetical protein